MENFEAGNEGAVEEGFSFDDSDHFEDMSLCSWMSEQESCSTNWRGWKRQNAANNLSEENQPEEKVISLMQLCAKQVAWNIPFEQVEKMYPPVPEEVQLEIAFWSFPDNEEDIRLYSCLANGSPGEFQRGEEYVKMKSVKNVLQIGFHLCGNVVPPPNSITKLSCSVAVTFDRCRITSCSCNCGLNAKWCAHVVALCLHRIQQTQSKSLAQTFKSNCLRAPVSESLSKLRRDQLQKFAQYIISELPQQILPTAQRLLDELLSSHPTEINALSGAPDPTAGPSMLDKSLWYLDESALNENIKKTLLKFCGPSPIVYSDVNSLYLSSTEPPAAAEYSSLLRPLRGREPEGIWNLLSIVKEMLKRRDSNAVLLLDIVTEQCLTFEQVAIWWYNTKTSSSYLQTGDGTTAGSHRPSNNISTEIAQHAAASMCDEIVDLWRLIILDPADNMLIRKNELKSRLSHFHEKTLEIIKRGKYKEAHLLLFPGFLPAIDACTFDWGSIEITLCNHIVNKQSRDIIARGNSHSLAAKADELLQTASCQAKAKVNLTHSVKKLSSGISKSSKKPYCLPLTHKQSDPESASDDSCIERDIERVHTAGNNQWEIAESSLDFTSDEISSTGSPVQFSISSSDDVDLHPSDNNQGESSIVSGLSSESKESVKSKPSLDRSKTVISVPSNPQDSEVEDAKLKKYRFEMDSLFTRAESLYAHGRFKDACELSCKLAEEVLNHPEDFITTPFSLNGNKKAWMRISTSFACKSMERALFLCNVLSEHPRHYTLAFRVGLQGLGLKRLPASSKTLEVKLFYQQGELAALMKRLPLGPREVVRLRDKASYLASIDSSKEFSCVCPMMLATFIFDAFCQAGSASTNSRGVITFQKREISQTDQDLGFKAAVNALSYKLSVSEAEHPLLCEGFRKQKGELALQMLVLFRDQQHKLRMILDNLLDKSLSPNLRASSAFPSASFSHRHSSKFGVGSNRNHLSLASDLQSSHSSVAQALDRLNVDESTDEDDGRSGYNDTLPGPHGDVKSSTSCDDEYPSSSTVCSPPRRDPKLSWRSPTVRPKRKQHCLANVNSSASEEAMLSDTSPRLRRRNLTAATNDVTPLSLSVSASAAGWTNQRYPSSPSSDRSSRAFLPGSLTPFVVVSGSSISNDSMGTSSGDSKRNFESSRYCPNRSPPRTNLASSVGLPGRPGYSYRRTRGRNLIAVPDIPNQPSESAAHFFFELAKNVFIKAGGSSTTSLFMQQPQGSNQSGVHRNLVLAAFEIGLYALGLHNCVSPNWLSRTYSSHVSWITGQAMEIGSAALHILIDSWEGHLTPPETASLADRASRGRDSTTVRRAAELALSVLPHAHALNQNEIQRALLQCREQGVSMLERACHSVELAGRGGGVFPEVLVDVARQWDWIHQQVNESGDNETNRVVIPAVSVPNIVTAPVPVSNTGAPVSNTSQATVAPPTAPSSTLPVSVGGVVVPGSVIAIQNPRMPIQCHPGAPLFPGFGPAVIDHQMTGVTAAISSVHPYAAVHLHHGPAIPLVPMPPSNLHALQYHAAHAPFLADPHVAALHHQNTSGIQPIQQMNIPSPPISIELQNAFRVGMLALDLLTKRTEDRPNSKYVRNPPYANDVKWILNLSIKLGLPFVQQFCLAAVGGVSSPFILHDIAIESAKFLTNSNNQPFPQMCTNLRANFLSPVVAKCLQMYIHFINHRLYHIHHTPADYDEFVNLVHTARNAFYMTPGGILQFNEVLQTINRSKSCKKDLWHKINAVLHL